MPVELVGDADFYVIWEHTSLALNAVIVRTVVNTCSES